MLGPWSALRAPGSAGHCRPVVPPAEAGTAAEGAGAVRWLTGASVGTGGSVRPVVTPQGEKEAERGRRRGPGAVCLFER